MKHQKEIHDVSWETRKPNQDVVAQKPRIKSSLSLLEDIIEDGDRIFDLGCGDGTLGSLIKNDNEITIDGCDISEVAASRARKSYNTVFQLNIDDQDIPVDSRSYDLVICTDVLEHTLSPIHALNEIERILKTDGTALISVPNFGFIRYRINSLRGKIPSIIRDERHYNTFTIGYLQDLMYKSGLEVQDTQGVSHLPILADAIPQYFAKTIIVTATVNHEMKGAAGSSRYEGIDKI